MRIFVIFCLSVLPLRAQADIDAATLKGLSGVAIVIEPPSETAKQGGLTEDVITTDAELRLRQSGVRVNDKIQLPNFSYLYIEVGVTEPRNGMCAFLIEVQMKQMTKLARDLNISAFATTWSARQAGVMAVGSLKTLRDDLRDLPSVDI
jgi:hypothetical protein